MSINKTLATLAAILDVAVERELIPRNPATVAGRRRRLPGVTPQRSWLASREQIEALLDGASRLDEEATVRHGQRRALLAVLVYGG
jgi:hypothetical protein